ncbi:MAG TPA: VOC family protein [Blastocatellia bacterium]|jgi:predicted enzyme related to lactoylglutathione lyase|nr:VOC family protein [Blastocatellia bacterium]
MPDNAKPFSYNVSHFDVHADDLPRARRFYETVFEWKFNPWGPPDFFLIATGKQDDPGIHGALTKRRTHVEGKPMFGYECTISVANVDETAAAIEANGGQVTLPKTCINGVGWIIQFLDTEGNVVCAMQYDENAE